MEMLKGWGGRVLTFVVVAGLAIGWKFYARSSNHDETKAELESLCEGEQECLQAVSAHFDACHEESFRMGGRRTAAHLDEQALVRCINRRAGNELFSVGP